MSRKVLVTAGASGIGRSIAGAFLAAGDDVFVCDVNTGALVSAAADLKGLKTGLCNIGDRGEAETMVADAAATLGGIDVLVNNAGISGPTAPRLGRRSRSLGTGAQGQPDGHVHRDEGRHSSPHRLRQWRHYRHVFRRRPVWLSEPKPLCDDEMGPDRVLQNALHGAGRAQHPRERHPPRRRDGDRIQSVLRERALAAGKSVDEIKSIAMANQSLKYLVDPDGIAALALFLASDVARSISGQTFPIDGDMQRN